MMAADTAKAAGLLEVRHHRGIFFYTETTAGSAQRTKATTAWSILITPELIEKIVASFAAHTGSAAMVVPGDLEPRRLGPEPPPGFAELRDRLEKSILSALHGIPPVAGRGNRNRDRG